MARRLRLQYEGALYHVFNRGNYRRDIFGCAGAAQGVEAALFEGIAQALRMGCAASVRTCFCRRTAPALAGRKINF